MQKSVLYLHPPRVKLWQTIFEKLENDSVYHRYMKNKTILRQSIYFSCRQIKTNYNEEFDPGSGWTLAAGLTHASRGVTGIACNPLTTGARVRNAYATYLLQGYSQEKFWITPHTIIFTPVKMKKTPVVKDGHASY